MEWHKIKGRVRFREPLSKHTTFKIGGPAKYFIEPRDYKDLKLTLGLLKKHRIPFSIIGSGSNILVSDKGVEKAVMRLSSPYFRRLKVRGKFIEAAAGARLSDLVKLSARNGVSGFEFLIGIPGSVGGALAMNAGAWGENIGDLVEKIKVMDYNGRLAVLSKRDIRFGYRSSGLSRYIVLEAALRFSKPDSALVQSRFKECLRRRRISQDLGRPSAGSIFKNPRHNFAAMLIDSCGLKGRSCRGAMISVKHANFILNRKQARAADVLELMDLIKKRVRAKFSLTLRPEIKIWM